MYRTHNNGELRIKDVDLQVKLCGWVQRSRDLGGMTFIDLRDRFGITQLTFNETVNSTLCQDARLINREWVIEIDGVVKERSSKNLKMQTGEIEIEVGSLKVLNKSKTPPFTIEDETDGGEELRMKYRFLDLRRKPLQKNMILRSKMGMEVRNFFQEHNFLEIETPYLIKSTPEGARDFIVPSRMNKQQFYALPQSPQTFKQLLMVSGYDRYFQIVKCFRDEDLRSDRQPEFTQIDCEMAFVDQQQVIDTFEGLVKHLFKNLLQIDFKMPFPVITYDNAIEKYGSDKPDLRFDMKLNYLDLLAKGSGFKVFDEAEAVVGINVPNCADYSRKKIDELTSWVKRPQIGAKGLAYVKYNTDGSFKSSIDKFYNTETLKKWASKCNSNPGDLILILSGDKLKVQKQMNELRLLMGERLGLRNPNDFKPVWVIDFPLLEKDEQTNEYHAMHHPFTSPKDEDQNLLTSNPSKVRANAYDLAINGVEVGGGSIRIHDRQIQEKMFQILGFTKDEAELQFGFLMKAFEYGAPPHGGIAFGFDRLCTLFGGKENIREFIAFPKNNQGKDVMIDAPSKIDLSQLNELGINLPKIED
ncbi:MAG: aspartate--tRNA ligase [Flavobacteriales bacterium]|jgi:aspartyl-tRNA synthetase|nr:aspartate--tRNA ligase [Flavobacteriales bacterium]MDG1440028.1 aspartate--tRNA ligase [Flavobacteriales bacterium]MDG1797491.1 aspartate--tRNA ligase [Flavobacteriales bacterium]